MNIFFCLCINILFTVVSGFFPHPVMRFGSQAEGSITHVEIVQLGFSRSLAQYFLDTRNSSSTVSPEEFKREHTIDELFQLVHPDWSAEKLKLHTFPLKSAVDTMQVHNTLVDLEAATKDLPTAHFDAETFVSSNRRVMNFRKLVIQNITSPKPDYSAALKRIGELLHTLQDFYSHSNWVEMEKTEINPLIGISENIGPVAEPNQATCSSNGCTKIKTKCNILENFYVKTCPMIYYDCKDNILPEILRQGILTSGYYANQFNEKKEPVLKPTNVAKCSHGSIIDTTAHQEPTGGINKDSTKVEYSPHYHLHLKAVKLAIEGTERFFNDLRKDIGNIMFENLFAIKPTQAQLDKAKTSIAQKDQFRFFSSTISIGLSSGDTEFQKMIKDVLQKVLDMILGLTRTDTPTNDVSDMVKNTKKSSRHLKETLIHKLRMINRKQTARHRHY